MTLGEFVKKTREARGLTQQELATLSGLGRSYISSIEIDAVQETSSTKILKLAKALRVKPDEMYIAQGLSRETKPHPISIIDRIRELETNLIAVPIIAELHMPGEIQEYIYVARPRQGAVNYVGVRAKGYCLEPDIKDGDVLIIDKDAQPEPGRTILCYHNGNEQPMLVKLDDTKQPKDCEIYGVIIGIQRRL